MVSVRPQPEAFASDGRFNVLLTRDREHAIEHWTGQLPRVLGPLGVRAFVADTGREALEVAEQVEVHAAVIDLSTPPGPTTSAPAHQPGGLWLLEVLSRRPNRPATVVVNSQAYTPGQIDRFLNEALRLGAFTVVNRPVEVHGLLVVIQRVIERRFRGRWPAPPHTPLAPDRSS